MESKLLYNNGGISVKKILVIGIAVITMVASGISLASMDQKITKSNLAKLEVRQLDKTGANGNFKTLKLGIPEPQTPVKLMAYKVVNTVIDKVSVENEAKKFGVLGIAKETPEFVLVKGDKGDLVVDKDTGSKNWITREYETRTTLIQNLLPDAEYVRLATEFLKQKNEYSDNYIFKGINTYKVDGQVSMVEVNFGKDLNGHSWDGVGPKKTVIFGDNGQVIGMFSVWREVEPLAEYPIMKPSEALLKIKEGKAMNFVSELNTDGTVEQVDIIYHNDPAGYNQKFVVPHYKFKGKTANGKPFVSVTRAVPDQFIQEVPYQGVAPVSAGNRKE